MSTVEHVSTAELAERSRAIIRDLQTAEGAYPASPDFSAYRGYCWMRDGAFIADAASAAGDIESAERFYEWCTAITVRYSEDFEIAIAAASSGAPLGDERMMPARFTFDGSRGTDDWWDFQLDGYGTWLWALGEHVRRHGVTVDPYAEAMDITARYLASSWDRPCYDWWEENRDHVHVSTLGCIGAGLESALALGHLSETTAATATVAATAIRATVDADAARHGHLVKWIGSDDVDASLAALISPLGYIAAADPVARATVLAIEDALVVDHGVHRYAKDTFYGGGQWPLLSCFLGLAHGALGDDAEARAYLAWAASTVRGDGAMPEQVPNHLLAASRRDEWVERWGTVATPLVWSHAMLLRLQMELSKP